LTGANCPGRINFEMRKNDLEKFIENLEIIQKVTLLLITVIQIFSPTILFYFSNIKIACRKL
jgi:hypothetical protein